MVCHPAILSEWYPPHHTTLSLSRLCLQSRIPPSFFSFSSPSFFFPQFLQKLFTSTNINKDESNPSPCNYIVASDSLHGLHRNHPSPMLFEVEVAVPAEGGSQVESFAAEIVVLMLRNGRVLEAAAPLSCADVDAAGGIGGGSASNGTRSRGASSHGADAPTRRGSQYMDRQMTPSASAPNAIDESDSSQKGGE